MTPEDNDICLIIPVCPTHNQNFVCNYPTKDEVDEKRSGRYEETGPADMILKKVRVDYKENPQGSAS